MFEKTLNERNSIKNKAEATNYNGNSGKTPLRRIANRFQHNNSMDTIFRTFLVIHIIAGTIGLLSGTINIIRKKGDKKHKLAGKFFLYGMLTVGLSAFVLSLMHTNYFLFIVGVFTFYMAATGDRYLSLRELRTTQKPKLIDWILTISMLLFGVAFIGFGIYHLINGENFGIVFIVFGFIGLRMVSKDIQNYKGKTEIVNYWLVAHLQRMIGAYIAALTAFLVVNGKYFDGLIPNYLLWLLPTLILLPLIIKWTKKYLVTKENNA
ncbi:MAG: hypothetical protein WBP08_19380 [Saprospiraceae bacterium]|nr:hypothetical protein [Saprospiraceae bacterium]